MTQKELLYLEDAIGHEDNIIKICREMESTLEDENLKVFMEEKIKTHTNMYDKLLGKLEEKANG